MGTKIEAKLPWTKKYQKSPEAEINKWRSSIEPSGAMGSSQDFDFGLLASRTVREEISVILSHQFCANLLQ